MIKIRCNMSKAEHQTNRSNTNHIQLVLEQKRRVKALQEQEIQLTAENPRIRNQEETTDICKELRLQKLENIVKEKRRLQLRTNSQKLRLCEMQLRIARVSKELAEQKADLQSKKEENLISKRKEDAEYEKQRLRNREAILEQELLEQQKKQAFRQVLLGQMEEKRALRQQRDEEVKLDRERMMQLQRQIEEAKQLELKELEISKQRTKKEIEEFFELQEKAKRNQRSQSVDEYKRFLEVMQERDKMQRNLEDARKKERDQKQALSEQIGQKVYAVQNEKRKKEDQLLDLLVEERIAKEDERFQQHVEKQLQERIMVRCEMEQFEINALRCKKEKLEADALLRKEAVRVGEECKKFERYIFEKHKQKEQEHGRVIQEIIRAKHQQRLDDIAENLQKDEKLHDLERKTDKEIEVERLRLLSREPIEVLRYLPTNTLNEADRKYLGLNTSK